MRSIREITELKDKRVLVRVDFNVPMKDGKVEDDFRIKKALPSIKFLQDAGAKIILISHLGKGGESLEPASKILNNYTRAKFVPAVNGAVVLEEVSKMVSGEVIVLENLRNEKGEQSGDENFAKELASLGDLYVNEAFPVSHREDASIVLLPKLLPAYAGLQLEEEVKNLSSAFTGDKHPFLFILGGAKFSTKVPLIEKYLELADHVYIGGALLVYLLKAKGYEVGKSLTDDSLTPGIDRILNDPKLILPEYVLTESEGVMKEEKINEVSKEEAILDVGMDSLVKLEPLIKNARLILWNGPLGKYEVGAGGSTKKVLELIAASDAESIIGGGDTVALVSEMKMEDKFTFVSTGGGATLDFLANGTLPGIKALG